MEREPHKADEAAFLDEEVVGSLPFLGKALSRHPRLGRTAYDDAPARLSCEARSTAQHGMVQVKGMGFSCPGVAGVLVGALSTWAVLTRKVQLSMAQPGTA